MMHTRIGPRLFCILPVVFFVSEVLCADVS
mgnify:CR=1 FL=1|jgi:hypothetical protein